MDSHIKQTVPELSISLVKDAHSRFASAPISCSEQFFNVFRDGFTGLDREHFAVVSLTAKNKPIGFHVVSVGSLTLSVVHPREVFKAAILQNAAAVILAHNHPSGDPTPSSEDKFLTGRLVEAGDILGIRVLDHIVFGDTTHYSFADNEILSPCTKESLHGAPASCRKKASAKRARTIRGSVRSRGTVTNGQWFYDVCTLNSDGSWNLLGKKRASKVLAAKDLNFFQRRPAYLNAFLARVVMTRV
ncbi:MAG: JAB domain-containing protein [Nitrospira sp.]|nr:JAB domain-containing protein [Nitrospira sp.]